MPTPLEKKSSTAEIRERFDNDVERFSCLETGQVATIDAPLAMDLITQAAVVCTSRIRRVLDIGCGAGNNTLKLLQQYGSDFDVDLLDLSEPMLTRAAERISEVSNGACNSLQFDFREADLTKESYDVVMAILVICI
ncbi:MAG: methyltransferase domain-containing protein, partial [Planctomycetota bacterium]